MKQKILFIFWINLTVVSFFLTPFVNASDFAGTDRATTGALAPRLHKRVLSIAGSDSSGGAGIQADLKTFSALGCYGMTVLTIITAQNTQRVTAIHSLPTSLIKEQIRAVIDDVGVDAIKIGALGNKEIIIAVAEILEEMRSAGLLKDTSIVVDPVTRSKNGDSLISEEHETVEALRSKLFPLATIITPNIHETAQLLRMPSINNKGEMEAAAFSLLGCGSQSAVVKSGSFEEKDECSDCLVLKTSDTPLWIKGEKVRTENLHGTGCTFSAAIASFLAHGYELTEAVKNAKIYVIGGLKAALDYKVGRGRGPVHHFFDMWQPKIFSQSVWEDISPLYTQILDHPFNQGIRESSLNLDLFYFYIQQDSLFLKERAAALRDLSLKVPESEDQEFLRNLSDRTFEALPTLFLEYGVPESWKSENSKESTQKYIGFMQKNAAGSFEEALAGLLPCAWIYQELGEVINREAIRPNRYEKWIETYSSLERRARIGELIDLTNKVASHSSPVVRIAMKRSFREATILELELWNEIISMSTES